MFRFLLCVTCFFVAACDSVPKTAELSGETMGTTYGILISDLPAGTNLDDLSKDIDATLKSVDDLSSNWNPNSEISNINNLKTVSPISVSKEMFELLAIANDIHIKSDGAFDTTLAPLIELWGFGSSKSNRTVPSDADIASAFDSVGQTSKLTLSENGLTIKKETPETTIHLAGYAKGYGIDRLGDTLKEHGLENYYIDVGGDLIVAGTNQAGHPWRLGIEKPSQGLSKQIEEIVHLTDRAMATSGDYRNYFIEDGVRFSHIINPQTGRPIDHSTASVTVISDSAVLADAWATALLVLGSERGLEISEQHNIASFFIDGQENDNAMEYTTLSSSAFDALKLNN